MSSLYNEDGFAGLSENGIQLHKETDAVLIPLFQKYIDMGYSSREIQNVIINATSAIDRIHRAMEK